MINFNTQNIKIIALIPARAGSKGIPGKNLRSVNGIPLIEFTINAASSSQYIDEIYLSSDSEDILNLGINLGCKTLKRPLKYSDDHSSAVDVVNHFLNEKCDQDTNILIIYLQPTSPLRTNIHIDQAIELIKLENLTSLVSVVEMEKSPYKSFKIDLNGRLLSLFDEQLSNSRRQDLPVCYVPNGAIYVFSKKQFIEHGGFPSNGSIPYVMSADESLDIDTEADILKLEEILRKKNGRV